MTRLPVDPQLVDGISKRVVATLERIGCAYRRRDGTVQRVRLCRRLVTESGSILLLEVDTQRLPHRVRAHNLTGQQTLHDLTTAVHRPVRILNTTGITYAVLLEHQAGRARLPRGVCLRDALVDHPGTPLTFPVGEGPAGPVWAELAGHYLVGGETGSGKTTWVLATVMALAMTNPKELLEVVLVDPKGVDFLSLAGLEHLARPIAVEPEEAAEVTDWLVAQVDERRRCFLRTLARSVDAYNARAKEKLPHILAVIDEVTDLALRLGQKSRFYKNLVRLSSIGRSFGIHLLLATQNPKAEVLNTLIRGNLAGRIAFRVTTPSHSRVILGQAGAEQLAGIPGRLLARLGDGRLQELQGYRVTEEEELVSFGQSDPLALLGAEAKAMLRYAIDELDGRFPEREICRALGVAQSRYRRVKDKLERAGILARGEKNALVVNAASFSELERLWAV